MIPVLKRVAAGGGLIKDASSLNALHAVEFGRMAELLGKFDSFEPADAGLRSVWLALMAEEYLLATLTELRAADEWRNRLADVIPFSRDNSNLDSLVERVCWVAVVPVHEPALPAGSVRRIWGFRSKGDGTAGGLQGGDGWVDNWVVRVSGGAIPEGRSWTLGASLAARCWEQRRPDLQFQLARDWLVTGVADGNRVDSVDAGNKVQICSTRRWLVPEACRTAFERVSPLHVASRLDEAWATLSGSGTLAQEKDGWPENISELHILVGQAVRPSIASILLARPRKIVFWHTCNQAHSLIPKDLMLAFCKQEKVVEWLVSSPEIEPRELPENDLASAEQILRAAGLAAHTAEPRVANITSGNRLMGMAMLNVARGNPSLWLVYKERGLELTDFVTIRHGEGLTRTGLVGATPPPSGVNWKFLTDAPDLKNGEVDDLPNLMRCFV